MYSFAQRRDVTALDEPFYAAYLNLNPDLDHPGRDEVLKSQATDPNEVAEHIIKLNNGERHVYVKDMAHHFADMKLDPFQNSKAIFLVRDPAKLIASFQKVIAKPTLKDIGLEEEWQLFQQYKKEGLPAFVVPTERLSDNPENSLRILCSALEIPYDNKMLNWPAGPKDYDGCWSKYWYTNAHKSTGFKPFSSDNTELDSHGKTLLELALPFYHSLSQHSLL